ncbi:MAG: 5-histidylcysteine sulfoxide synthase [Pseudonocardiaceae bacterium]
MDHDSDTMAMDTRTRDGDARLIGVRDDWWFTGVAPRPGHCPGVDGSGRITSLPLPDLARCSRQDVLDYFDNSWTLQETLFAGLQTAEPFYRAPDHNLRHPLIFYYGHPAALYLNKLRVAGLVDDSVNAYYEEIFETGVDEMSWDDLSKNEMVWPRLDEVHAYRSEIYRIMRDVITKNDFAAELGRAVTMDDPGWAVFMGFEHDRIHLETSSVLIRELPARLASRHPAWPSPATSARTSSDGRLGSVRLPDNDMLEVPAGDVVVGKPRAFPSYGWDNEYGHRRTPVSAFKASRYLISNGEYYVFVTSGGYQEQRHWSADGWGWRSFRNAKWPRFWVPDGPAGLHAYRLRTVFDEIRMPWDWPVCVNYHEAKAYCAWRGERDGVPYRLVTEAEHHRMRNPLPPDPGPTDDPVMCHSGHALASQGININLAFGSETPVDASPPSAAGFGDVFGNVWQWCEDHFHPLPGFAVHPFYDDFSIPCFDGEHQMILGGSFISTGAEASIWARFHFRPHFLQHSGIRLAQSVDGADNDAVRLDREIVHPANDIYRTRQSLNQYLLMHYGTAEETLGTPSLAAGVFSQAHGFSRRVVGLLVDTARAHGVPLGDALDLGCAVGGATFELSKHFDRVLGLDYSPSFIDTARELARAGSIPYQRIDQGERSTALWARVDPAAHADRVEFQVADACALPTGVGSFDSVLLANILCRLPDPRACLARMCGADAVLRPGGLLLVASPWSWTAEFTERPQWLGASPGSGSSDDALHEFLSVEYELIYTGELPMVLRDHERRFQYVLPRTTIWRRNSETHSER